MDCIFIFPACHQEEHLKGYHAFSREIMYPSGTGCKLHSSENIIKEKKG